MSSNLVGIHGEALGALTETGWFVWPSEKLELADEWAYEQIARRLGTQFVHPSPAQALLTCPGDHIAYVTMMFSDEAGERERWRVERCSEIQWDEFAAHVASSVLADANISPSDTVRLWLDNPTVNDVRFIAAEHLRAESRRYAESGTNKTLWARNAVRMCAEVPEQRLLSVLLSFSEAFWPDGLKVLQIIYTDYFTDRLQPVH